MENESDEPLKIHESKLEYIEIMKKCWQHKPEDRYTFREITPLLEKIQNDLN